MPSDVESLTQPPSSRPETAGRVVKDRLQIGRFLYPEVVVDRPKTRADCVDGIRPCPYLGCRHHIGTECTSQYGPKLNFPDVEPWDLTWSCSLDIAEAGGATLEAVGRLMNITRERVRQIEAIALAKLALEDDLVEHIVDDAPTWVVRGA